MNLASQRLPHELCLPVAHSEGRRAIKTSESKVHPSLVGSSQEFADGGKQ